MAPGIGKHVDVDAVHDRNRSRQPTQHAKAMSEVPAESEIKPSKRMFRRAVWGLTRESINDGER
jgi:hypothetical protein